MLFEKIQTMNLKLFTCSFFSLIFLSSAIKLPKTLREEYKLIPGGLAKVDSDTLSLQTYYIKTYEVSNREYNQFLRELEENGTEEERRQARIRNENWNSEFENMNLKTFSELYHTHSAFADYPVVNITFEGAKLYCKWVEKKINEELKKAGVRVKVRLPERAELIRAGAGDDLWSSYAWKGAYMRNAKGNFLCNFTCIPQSFVTRDEEGSLTVVEGNKFSEEKETYLIAHKKSYWPSEFGVYNLNGNVSEMTARKGETVGGSWSDLGYDVRLQSLSSYQETSCKVGFRVVFSIES